MIYLSGPMSGLPAFNFPAFEEAARILRAQGHQVIAPHEDTPDLGLPWEHYLRKDLLAMLTHCHSIVLLPGWEQSRGAQLEYHVAVTLGFTVYELCDGELRER